MPDHANKQSDSAAKAPPLRAGANPTAVEQEAIPARADFTYRNVTAPPPPPETPQQVIQLQRLIGNRATTQLIQRDPIEPSDVHDTTVPILPEDRDRVTEITEFLVSARDRINQRLESDDPEPAWVSRDNPNIPPLLEVLDLLIADLQGQSIIIRFTPPTTGTSLAAYESTSNTLSISRDAPIGVAASGIVHEYTHRRQDIALEQRALEQTDPFEIDREAALQNEIGAWRNQAYFVQLLEAVGMSVGEGGRADQERQTTSIYHGMSEAAQTGSRADRRVAESQLHDTIASAYNQQLDEVSPARHYRIDITESNHALLHTGHGEPTDLGEIEDIGENLADVQHHILIGRIRSLLTADRERFNQLFIRRPSRGRRPAEYYVRLNFSVIIGGENRLQFTETRPSDLASPPPH